MSEASETTGQDAKLSRLSEIKDAVEVTAKISLGVIAFLYGVGILVVSLHLREYGVYSLSFFRLGYILAGVWAVLPFAICISMVMAGIFAFYGKTFSQTFGFKSRTLKFIDKFIIGILMIISLPIGIYVATRHLLPEIATFDALVVPMILGTFTIIYVYKHKQKEIRPYDTGSIAILMLFMVYVFKFATNVYTTIPAHLGGGQFSKVRLVLDLDQQFTKELQLAGIPLETFDKDSNKDKGRAEAKEINRTTKEIDLILVTDADYFIMGSATAVSIPKAIVKAVLYKHPKFGWHRESSITKAP
jgi:hypothetical protein